MQTMMLARIVLVATLVLALFNLWLPSHRATGMVLSLLLVGQALYSIAKDLTDIQKRIANK